MIRRPLNFVLLSFEYWFAGLSLVIVDSMLSGHCTGSGSPLMACVTGQTGIIRTGFSLVAVGYIGVAYLLRKSGEAVWQWWLGEWASSIVFTLVALLFLADKVYVAAIGFAAIAITKVIIAVMSRRRVTL